MRDCTSCPLRQTCNQVVWANGPIDPMFLFVGEYPQEGEDIEGEPFVDRQGYHFRKLIGKIAEQSCFTYAVKCKPASPKQINDEVIDACAKHLYEDIRWLQPPYIITLGKIPTRLLLNLKKSFKLADYIGQKFASSHLSRGTVVPWYSLNTILNSGSDIQIRTAQQLEKLSNGTT